MTQVTSVYIPGKGEWNSDASRADEAAGQYDERLSFRRNPDTGDWCVYYATGHGVGIPVLGFGRDIPDPEFLTKRVYESDTVRHGETILNKMNDHNAAIRKEREDKASDASGEMAEVLEWAHRREGIHPSPRIFVPKGI